MAAPTMLYDKQTDKSEFGKECDCMKRGSKANVILSGLWAVLAAFKVFLQILRLKYNPSVIWLVLSIILLVFWTIFFVVEVKRYRANKDKQ